MTSESDTDKASASTPKKQRLVKGDLVKKEKHRLQKYRVEWENGPIFSRWIARDYSDIYKAQCKVCETSITAEKQDLVKHSEGKKHLKNLSVIRGSKSVTSYFASTCSSSSETNTKKMATVAEIKLAAYLAENNIAFNAADHLGKLLK
ncbi:unnamed protein product [Parnassius apollo]|uniref:(apollo) hypothetical protein n=1 Tax=Parnassius apollo TaxID=110799 RepID=A0A8S3WB44_PARAO|nr:unnamed protein product [Parnassius apollo]